MARSEKIGTTADRLSADRARALKVVPVSDAVVARLDRFVELLLQWQKRINLVAHSTVPELWMRHVADSLQLAEIAPDARVWVDLGSGAGFPGIVIACVLAERAGVRVHLVESNAKKAAFLREAVRVLDVPAEVHAKRIEDVIASFASHAEAVTARALAPLSELLEMADPLLKTGAKGLFLKGQDVEAELTEAAKCWTIKATLAPSKTSPQARIVVIHSARRKDRQ